MKAVGLIWLAGLALLLNGCFPPGPDDGVCGDGYVDTVDGEECDDGNQIDHDGCDSTCTWSEWQIFTPENTVGGLVHDHVRAIAIDSAGGKWFGTGDWNGDAHEGGVSHLSADNTTWTTYTTANTGGGLAGFTVQAIAIDSEGGKWFGAYGGVSHLSADNTSWTTYTTANSGLVHNSVYAIALDSADGKWVGTFGGVSHLSADNNTWTPYTTENTGGGLAYDYVEAIAIDSAGGKWFGTKGISDSYRDVWVGAVSYLSAGNTAWTTFTTENTNGGLVDNAVDAIAIDSEEGKWFGTHTNLPAYVARPNMPLIQTHLSYLSADNATWMRIPPIGMEHSTVNAIAIDSAGGKWFGFGTYGGGVSHLSADNTTWTTYTYDNTGGGLKGTVLAIAIDSAGGKWFGTSGGVSYWAAAFGM